jgi:hypothetical protein
VRVLIFEDNLMWSQRLAQSVKGLGHGALVLHRMPGELPPGDAAIVNLGSPRFDLGVLVTLLKDHGVFVVGHAGHKEKPLLQLGNEHGCDLVVSNSVITFKLDQVLAQAGERSRAEIPDEEDKLSAQ